MNRLTVGRLKWRTERIVSYLQRMGSLVMFAASFKILEIDFLWFTLLPVAFLVLWYIDKKFLYPGESAASFRENPEWNKLMEKINDR